MGRIKLRKIVVDGAEYLWKFEPGYREKTDSPGNPYECFDIFTAFLAGRKHSPLRVHFITWECAIVGGPLRYGGPLVLGDENSGINLHTPKWAAVLIRLARDKGWTPAQSLQPLQIEDGMSWLAELGFNIHEHQA